MATIFNNPYYYLRTWTKTFPVPAHASTWLEGGAKAARLALPFIALYQPAGSAISYTIGAWGFGLHLITFINSKQKSAIDYANSAKGLIKSAAECSATFFQLKYGLLVHNLIDLGENLTSPQTLVKKAVPVLSNLFYLALLFKRTTTYQTILLSLSFQAALSFYQMCATGYDIYRSGKGWKQEKSLDALAHGAMGAVRLYQTYGLYSQIQNIQSLLEKTAAEDPQKIADDVTAAASKQKSEGKKNSALTIDLEGMGSDEFLRMIEDHKVILTDIKGIGHNYGSHFHGFGKGLVSGMNLTFKNRTLQDGRQIVELTFELNHVYRNRVSEALERVKLDPNLKVESVPFILGKNPHVDQCIELTKEGVGTCSIGTQNGFLKNRVIVQVNQDLGLNAFQQLLAPLGLSDVLKRSTNEDIERMKIGLLFRIFDPRNAFDLERSSDFFEIPIDQLKMQIVEKSPAMQKVFDNLPRMQEKEIFPGYIRYIVPGLVQAIYDQGARALTAALRADRTNGYAYEKLDKCNIACVANIMKMGMLSLQQRKLNGSWRMEIDFEASDVVFTQIIVDRHLQTPLNEFSTYSQDYYPIRLLFSLNSLETGSYQYLTDYYGLRDDVLFKNRPSIFELIAHLRYFLWPTPSFMQTAGHELMIKDRIKPEEIKGMWVDTAEHKNQIIKFFNTHHIIEKDALGAETINGVPLDQFFHTGENITEVMVESCAPEQMAETILGLVKE